MEEDSNKIELSIWVLLLRFVAGYINVMTILLFAQMLAGHTGSLTTAAMLFADGDIDAMFRVLGMTFSFFVGTIVSGYFYPKDKFHPRLQYGTFLIVMGIILFLFATFGSNTMLFLTYISFSLGLQNGMFVFYKALVVRTTILTGTITDIGVEIGRKIKGISTDQWKMRFHIINVICFMLGASSGMAVYLYTDWSLLLVAAIIDIAIGLYFFTLRDDLVETISKSMKDD